MCNVYSCRLLWLCHTDISMDWLQVPGGPAHKHLEPGDVLIRINGEVSMLSFVFIYCCGYLSTLGLVPVN